jgi:hypothetical protein
MNKMLTWPKDERKYVAMTELLKPVKEAFHQFYQLTRTKVKGINYSGYPFGPIGRASSLDAKELLNPSNVSYDENE